MRTDWRLAQFCSERGRAVASYVEFVRAGVGLPSVWEGLKAQIYLGSERFIENAQRHIDLHAPVDEIPRVQRRPLAKPLGYYAATSRRTEAMAMANLSGRHSMAQIARHFGVHYSTVSRAVRALENNRADRG